MVRPRSHDLGPDSRIRYTPAALFVFARGIAQCLRRIPASSLPAPGRFRTAARAPGWSAPQGSGLRHLCVGRFRHHANHQRPDGVLLFAGVPGQVPRIAGIRCNAPAIFSPVIPEFGSIASDDLCLLGGAVFEMARNGSRECRQARRSEHRDPLHSGARDGVVVSDDHTRDGGVPGINHGQEMVETRGRAVAENQVFQADHAALDPEFEQRAVKSECALTAGQVGIEFALSPGGLCVQDIGHRQGPHAAAPQGARGMEGCGWRVDQRLGKCFYSVVFGLQHTHAQDER